jgi:peroxiredoxin
LELEALQEVMDDIKKFGLSLIAISPQLPEFNHKLIDQSSIIRYAEVDPDYTIRPEPDHTIEALKAL